MQFDIKIWKQCALINYEIEVMTFAQKSLRTKLRKEESNGNDLNADSIAEQIKMNHSYITKMKREVKEIANGNKDYETAQYDSDWTHGK